MKQIILHLIITLFLATLSTNLWACTFDKGVYELVEDSTFRLEFLPPDSGSAVQLATAKITNNGQVFLHGYVTASQGLSTIYFVPDNPSLADANLSILPLGKDLRGSGTDHEIVVLEDLPVRLYYSDRELWEKHQLVFAIWQRIACR